jgi:hypothetical protein
MPKSSAQFGKYSPDGSVQLPLLATPAEIMGHHSADTEKGGAPSVIALDYQGGFGKTLGETKGRIQQLFDRKLSESSPEFRASIAKKGVQVPVGLQANPEYKEYPSEKWPGSTETRPSGKVGQLQVQDGHHRLAVAHKYAPNDLIPLTYASESTQYSAANKGETEGLPSSDKNKWTVKPKTGN